MKTYFGDRTIDGVMVTVDGQPLAARDDLKDFAGADFEWSYEGDAPSQLAFAMLFDHLGDAGKAAALTPRFMRDAVANFQNEWEMTSADIDSVIASDGAAAA
ncbi:DUF6166 domain-containing protein [Chenggangzhangella methanolivorans]|uniref:Uncharacterized protein n=1 Tax=Chenggangzhangella methanolivorans TaxID=1437009 RepID=A0A9E6RCS2_9HYPH|nr:DUF6166 domain-containing protein [Chenggangzhangella methanolivorans]QZO01455.1 hypothetical protein K6K41_08460 [Chenggangzhangella methanolivorans]